jgi:arylsulfatase A
VSDPTVPGHKEPPTFQTPPLIFQLENDPSERFPLDPATDEYVQASATLTAAAAAHQAGLGPGKMAPSEMAKGLDPELRVCGCPNSQAKYPTLPNCTCNPENWDPALVACDPGVGGVEVGVGAMGLDGPSNGLGLAWALDPTDARTWPVQPSFVLQEQ